MIIQNVIRSAFTFCYFQIDNNEAIMFFEFAEFELS